LEKIVGQLTAPTFVIPRPLSGIPRPPEITDSSDIFADWAKEIGGVYANEMGIAFNVRGETADLSLITDVRIEVVKRAAPLTGIWVAPSGGGGEPTRFILADLDQEPPSMRMVGWSDPLSVSAGDVEVFSVIVQTKSCDCSWRIKVEYIDSDGDPREAIVDDDGEPFRVTSSVNTTARAYAPQTADENWPR